jgi:hypothetical protein
MREHDVSEFAPLFLFTAEDPATVDSVSLFTRPCWTVPFEPAPVALLAFPAPATTVRLDRTHYLSPEAYDQFLHATGEPVPIVAAERDLT